jgi:nucleoside-diphosphate-sugar epimerase
MREPISVYGATGFVGSEFCRQTDLPVLKIPREDRKPQSKELLYFISTTHNYHVFDDILRDVNVNLKVLLEVLDHLREGSFVFNFISSWFVYGDTPLPATEESECHPRGFYSITKRAAEQLLISFCETFGLHYRIFRLCNAYGPGDRGASQQKNALQFLIRKLRNHEDVSLYHGGMFFRDYLHVSDVARAIDLCLKKAPLDHTMNIGSGQKLLFRDLIQLAHDLTGSKGQILSMDPPPFHRAVQVKDFYMDTRRLRELGFEPRVSVQEGIAELCR